MEQHSWDHERGAPRGLLVAQNVAFFAEQARRCASPSPVMPGCTATSCELVPLRPRSRDTILVVARLRHHLPVAHVAQDSGPPGHPHTRLKHRWKHSPVRDGTGGGVAAGAAVGAAVRLIPTRNPIMVLFGGRGLKSKMSPSRWVFCFMTPRAELRVQLEQTRVSVRFRGARGQVPSLRRRRRSGSSSKEINVTQALAAEQRGRARLGAAGGAAPCAPEFTNPAHDLDRPAEVPGDKPCTEHKALAARALAAELRARGAGEVRLEPLNVGRARLVRIGNDAVGVERAR